MKNTLLKFLFDNAVNVKTPIEWCGIIGVQIVDDDGWCGRLNLGPKNINEPVGLPEFVNRLSFCTFVTSKSPL